MKYRRFGKTEEQVSVLGFGMMRLPLNSDDTKDINEPESIKMIRKSIDSGVNYIDTAYPYHGEMSEPFTAKVLRDGYRDKVKLATKLPSWLIESREDMDKYLNEQLDKLETEYIDFYLVHALNKDFWSNLTNNNLFEFLDTIKKDGRVKYVGFSFHEEYDLFEPIVDAYDWDFCQIQLNYMDTDYQAGLKGLKYASDKDLGIVIMEPLRGGSIATNVPDDIMEIWNSTDKIKSPVNWALDYLYDMEDVHVVLSGMSEMSHVDENIKIAAASESNSLSDDDKDIIERVKETYKSRIQVNCTACNYCMPCPSGVNIPGNFRFFNNGYIFNDLKSFKNSYWMYFDESDKAHHCTECGKCIPECPQQIDIIKELHKVVELFGKEK